MLDDKILSLIKDFAISNSEKDDIHGFSHVERVYNLCVKLGKKLNANLRVLQVAALLHDIGRIHEIIHIKNKKNHAELSAEFTHKFLQSQGFSLSQEEHKNIIHCIRSHSFSSNSNPQTLEAKILSDVDKLDALGAIGLYRTIGFTIKKKGDLNQVIEHIENKILKLKDLMNLDISKKIAEDRELIIYDFYKKILKQKSKQTN
ncbi:MAG: HD domain-containing protein [Candidatus Hodarchaeota archaeon]